MEYKYRGVTASLTLITVIALIVSFVASAQRHNSEDSIRTLKNSVSELRLSNKRLEEKVRWIEGKYAQARTFGRQVNHSLLREQAENQSLREKLHREKQQAARDAVRKEGLRAALGAAARQVGGQAQAGVRLAKSEHLGERIPLASAQGGSSSGGDAQVVPNQVE